MADPGNLARDLLQKNFSKFGSFRTLVTFRDMPQPVYDPDTGIVDKGTPVLYPLYGIFLTASTTGNVDQQYDDTVIRGIEKSFIFPAADLAVTPAIGDEILAQGITWRVMALNTDPRPAHYSLTVRPLAET